VKISVNRNHLLEFILVFAAVALGFVAENVREYYSDKAREKEFIRSLVGNLKADLGIYAKRDSALAERVVWMDTLISLVTGTEKNRNAEMYLLARYSTRIIQGRPGAGTLNFLSRSGSVEYTLIGDARVKDNIQRYEARLVWLSGLVDLEEEQAKGLWSSIPQVFDTKVFFKMALIDIQGRFDMPPGNPPLLSRDPMVLNQLAYLLYLRRGQFASELTNHVRIAKECRDLIMFLETEYDLEG
jgi:hypothetical protein